MTQYEQWLRDICDAMCEYDKGDSLRIHHLLKVHSFARQIALYENMDEHSLFIL